MSPFEYQQNCENRFISFCISTIQKAFKKILRELYRFHDREVSLSYLSESEYEILVNNLAIPAKRFQIQKYEISIYDPTLAEALQRLSCRHREIILLYYILGFHDVEIAKMLGISKSAVQNNRHIVLSKLKTMMEDSL